MYTRETIQQALIERHSPKTQELFNSGRVAVAGLGGLGSNIACLLARIGVGHLHLIDFDKVELSNLNRQQYFLRHVGMYKTDALREILLQINPYLEIRTDCVRVTEQNLLDLFDNESIICEAFDAPEAKSMLACGILEHFPDKKLIAASGMAGYGSSGLIHTRRVSENFYLCGDEVSENLPGQGLMAPRVAVCAAQQANMVTRLLLGECEA
ncbi:MAG: sulfur carrier protein ThiS adenylyltransferase ThiF [Lachnospiraceae bacterium]|nr:sulfur carrier protein ThiS adenylyltransferase ThiF [Lachnospiraceae bacterium]